jgi:hypothetical protein
MFFPLAFLLFFSPARVEIDGGESQKVGWKTTELSVTPGTHRLRVFFVYLWILGERGNAEIEVSVAEGQTVEVKYNAPLIVFSPGKIKLA